MCRAKWELFSFNWVSLTLICAAALSISLIYLGTPTNLFSSLVKDIGHFFSDLSYFLSDLFYIETIYVADGYPY